jgi:UDP-N-acetylglucosamine acyltransferase
VTCDIPPYMLASGNEKLEIRTINIVGLRRAGISESTITLIKRTHRLIFREYKQIEEIRDLFQEELDGIIPIELSTLLHALELQNAGKVGRAREVFRNTAGGKDEPKQRRAA